MPTWPPRENTTKKQLQLAQREEELQHALRCDLPQERVLHTAERVRAAKLSLIKAELHWLKESEIRGRSVQKQVQDFKTEALRWENLPVELIIQSIQPKPIAPA